MDWGANTGDASVYFLNVYRDANVVALEPDPENAALARLNLAPYGARAMLLETGIWPRRAHLRLRPSERCDKAQVDEASTGEPYDCLGIDPLTVMTQAGHAWIDLFKCDIEGGEEQLFGRDPDPWLEKTGCIVAEIHSEVAARVVYAATGRHGFRAGRYRDLHVFERSPQSGRLGW